MVRNTVLYNLVFIILGTVLAVATAIILNEIRSKMAKQAYQTIILIPFLISMVIVSYLAYAFLSTSDGFINNTLVKLFGIEKIDWYNTPKYWPFILVIINVWKGLGYNMILYYATICGIDSTLYEAAVVDGATRWQKVVHVTLPSLRPTIIILTLMALGGIFRSDFGLFYQVPMNSGPLINVTQTIDTYVYRGLIQNNNVGMSSAAGLYQSVVGFVLVSVANGIVRKIDNESSLF
jgi:putative aldouronate transport system permease protein